MHGSHSSSFNREQRYDEALRQLATLRAEYPQCPLY
jgi:hypothetical protein